MFALQDLNLSGHVFVGTFESLCVFIVGVGSVSGYFKLVFKCVEFSGEAFNVFLGSCDFVVGVAEEFRVSTEVFHVVGVCNF